MDTDHENADLENDLENADHESADRSVFCYISCSCLPTRKISTHCVDVGSALKNNAVQAGLVFVV